MKRIAGYDTIIGPHEMHPMDMRYVAKILRSVGIKVKNIGRETYSDSTKQLLVERSKFELADNIYGNLKYKEKKDLKMAQIVAQEY